MGWGAHASQVSDNKTGLPIGSELDEDAIDNPREVFHSEALHGHKSYLSNLGNLAFNSPYILGDVARKAHISCGSCHVTWDEAGGYYDSGFIQPIDFFGDGPRIPLLVLSSYSTGGKVNHTYGDHVSLLKFIERNWRLQPLTDRSRDNLPNAKMRADQPYVPANMPALSDLFDMFDFSHPVNQSFLQ